MTAVRWHAPDLAPIKPTVKLSERQATILAAVRAHALARTVVFRHRHDGMSHAADLIARLEGWR